MAPFVLGNLCSENSHIETMINGLFTRDSAELAHESIGDHNAAFGHPVKLTRAPGSDRFWDVDSRVNGEGERRRAMAPIVKVEVIPPSGR